MIPAAWAFASASAIWMANFSASFNFIPRRGINWPSVLPCDIFHDNEVHAVLAGDIVDGDDVGMVQGRGGLGFLDESPLALRIGHQFWRKHLDGNEAIQMRVARLVDDPHPAFAETRENLVVPNLPTGQRLAVLQHPFFSSACAWARPR